MANSVSPVRQWASLRAQAPSPAVLPTGQSNTFDRSGRITARYDAWILLFLVLLGYIANVGKGGPLSLLPLLAIGTALFTAYPKRYLLAIGRTKVVFCLPLLAVSSFLWSRHPDISLKLSLEMLGLTIIGVVLASTVTPRAFLSALLCATLLIDAVGFAFGTREFIYMTNEFANNGFFGSKNNFGMFCAILVLTSLSLLVDKTRNAIGTLIAASGLLVGIALIIQAKSLGAMMTCALAVSVIIGGVMMRPVRHENRLPIVIGLVLAVVAVLGTAFIVVGGLDPFLALVGKSSNLTGRTVLWEQARRQWDMRPSLGLGYQAFWVQGTAEAEALWRAMKINNRMGFHFHNTFYAVAVELGSVGLWVFVLSMIAMGRQVFKAALVTPSGAQLCFASLFTLIVLRLPTEVDTLLPFNHGTLLLPIIYAFSNRAIAEAGR